MVHLGNCDYYLHSGNSSLAIDYLVRLGGEFVELNKPHGHRSLGLDAGKAFHPEVATP